MTLSKIKKVGVFSNDADSQEIVARAKHVNPIIDKVNDISSEDGILNVGNGSVSSPSIQGTGAAGVIVTATTAGFTTAGSHEAVLSGAGRWIVESTSTTGGIGIDTTTGLVPVMICIAPNNIAAGAGGAIFVDNYCTTINADADGDAFTLADGVTPGQLKKIIFVSTAGGTGVVTSKFTGAGTTLTFTNAGEYAILMWNGTYWIGVELSSVITTTHAPVIA